MYLTGAAGLGLTLGVIFCGLNWMNRQSQKAALRARRFSNTQILGMGRPVQ